MAGSPHRVWAVLAESGCLWGQPPAQRLLETGVWVLALSQLTQPLSFSFEMVMRRGDDPRLD